MHFGGLRRWLGVIAACAAMVACGIELVGARDPDPSPEDAGSEGDAHVQSPPDSAICEASPCVVDLSAGWNHTCVAIQGERPRCWGANDAGQLGLGTSDGAPDLTPSTAPKPVKMEEPATSVSVGGIDENGPRPFACAIGASGDVWCWGDDTWIQRGRDAGASVPARVANVAAASELHTGGQHACARSDAAGLLCWGRSVYGQNGRLLPPPGIDTVPVPVATRTRVHSFSLGNFHSCAALDDGTVDCWGYNAYGQLGNAAGGAQADAATILSIASATVIGAGHAHTCAVHSGGMVSCWGYNIQHQLGREPPTFPLAAKATAMPDDAGARDVCCGYIHSCALLEDGTMACWGNNAYGQLGISAPAESPVPVRVTNVANVSKIACGGLHTCALHASGEVSCWGSNLFGQLGRNADSAAHFEAAPVAF